jgi:hypothetical protein
MATDNYYFEVARAVEQIIHQRSTRDQAKGDDYTMSRLLAHAHVVGFLQSMVASLLYNIPEKDAKKELDRLRNM